MSHHEITKNVRAECAVLLFVIWVLPNMALAKDIDRELVILHTNDVHARVVGVDGTDSMCTLTNRNLETCFGGFDRIYTKVMEERSLHKNVLVLDAGDQFQGTMFHLLYHGLVSANFMNQIKYDAMAVGNHELDNGPKTLADFVQALNFPLLSANIDASGSPELKQKIKPYTIIKHNGLRVGIVGYTTEDTAFLSNPGPAVKFKPIIASVQKAVAELKAAKVDVIIALSHSGLNKDIEVAKKIDGIAAIVCGHSNSLLSNIVRGADGPSPLVVESPSKHPVLLVSAYAYGKYLGKLRFSFDSQGKPLKWESEPILLDSKIARNPTMTLEINKFYQPIIKMEQEKIGDATVDIDGHMCRFEECVFGNLLADAMLDYSRKFGVVAAFMNGGGIRASIPKGPINQAQLKEVLPFEKNMVFLKVAGSVIREVIEHGVAFVDDKNNDNTGRFLQVAGVTYAFDARKPRGQRVRDIRVMNPISKKYEALDGAKLYSIVTNHYLVAGGDNFTQFAKYTERWHMPVELKDLLTNYLKTPLAQLPIIDGRIVNLAKAPNATSNVNRTSHLQNHQICHSRGGA